MQSASLDEIATSCRTILLSLPGGKEVEQICLGEGGLVSKAKLGWTVIDLSTAPVSLARRLYAEFEGRASAFADAPVARTRQAAIDGTLSIMVGGTPAVLRSHRAAAAPHGERGDLLRRGGQRPGGEDPEQHDPVPDRRGARRSAVDRARPWRRRQGAVRDPDQGFGRFLRAAQSRHEGDAAGVFPERAFSTEYALKDLSYAIQMAEERGVPALGADVARELMERAVELGHGKEYWPVLLRAIEDGTKK